MALGVCPLDFHDSTVSSTFPHIIYCISIKFKRNTQSKATNSRFSLAPPQKVSPQDFPFPIPEDMSPRTAVKAGWPWLVRMAPCAWWIPLRNGLPQWCERAMHMGWKQQQWPFHTKVAFERGKKTVGYQFGWA